MEKYICVTCGVQYAPTPEAPHHCLICEDERQYIGHNGQQWTTMAQLQQSHHNRIDEIEPNLTGIETQPGFAIGQQALLVRTPLGNVLWDCISLLDDASMAAVRQLGGIRAIAVSHPHLVGSLVEWSRAFDNAPVYWHADNREWAAWPDPALVFWDGETCPLWDGLSLVRCGGHFSGSAVLHWAGGAQGRGALLAGDTITVVQDRRYVSFMVSYPNLIPLSAPAVNRIVQALEPYQFERIYGGWRDAVVTGNAKAALKRSADRYVRAINQP